MYLTWDCYIFAETRRDSCSILGSSSNPVPSLSENCGRVLKERVSLDFENLVHYMFDFLFHLPMPAK